MSGVFHLDSDKVRSALREKGYTSLQQLSRKLRLHRNTLGNYLAGGRIFPEALERMLLALELSPKDVISGVPRGGDCTAAIAELLDRLNAASPSAAFALFGSRARGTEKAFSDYDVGVFREEGLQFSEFSKLLNIVGEWNETEMTNVQLTNLSVAEEAFLNEVAPDLRFLTGSRKKWLRLVLRAGAPHA